MSLPHFVAIVFFVCAICLVSKGKLPLRFSFFWLSLSVIILIAAFSLVPLEQLANCLVSC